VPVGDRLVARAQAFALACAALLAIPAAAGEPRGAAVRQGEAGCAVRVGPADAQGISSVTAECHWPIAPAHVIAIIRDQEDLDQVLSSLAESTGLPDGRVVQVHSMGTFVADRQVTLRVGGYGLADGGFRLDFRRAERQERLGAGRVQIAHEQGWWEIHPDGSGGTRLGYALRYDPGGNLRPWLVRRFQEAGVARSLDELRRAAERVAAAPAVAAGPGFHGAGVLAPAP